VTIFAARAALSYQAAAMLCVPVIDQKCALTRILLTPNPAPGIVPDATHR
jgi:hypothetical protein